MQNGHGSIGAGWSAAFVVALVMGAGGSAGASDEAKEEPCAGWERTATREMALRLYKDGGVGRFYRGLGFTVLRAGPVAGVLLPTFDLTLYFLRQLR